MNAYVQGHLFADNMPAFNNDSRYGDMTVHGNEYASIVAGTGIALNSRGAHVIKKSEILFNLQMNAATADLLNNKGTNFKSLIVQPVSDELRQRRQAEGRDPTTGMPVKKRQP